MKNNYRYCILLMLLLLERINSQGQNWQLVWSDEFNTGISGDWVFETGGGGWGNNELEYYRSENASVQNGKLVMTAKHENFGGNNYTSVRMKTQGRKSWKYGKIEASIAMPSFTGSWPAFWMLGDNISSVGWPKCGEIDIMEHINTGDNDYGTIHWADAGGGHVQYSTPTNVNNVTAFHTYTVIWNENSITWLVDGIQYAQANIANNINNTAAFHNNFFILLNFAIGGNWPGFAVDNNAFPASMQVDYVRVYQDNGVSVSPSTGLVTVYKDCNYTGFSGGLGVGDYTTAQLNALGVMNNDVSSLRVTQGYKAILYDGDNFTGNTMVVTADNSCIGSFNDVPSSIQIRPNGDPNKGGIYFLQNRNSGLFMDVTGGLSGQTDGVNIQQWTSNNQANQQFQFNHLGDGLYQVLATHSMKSMDVNAISTADGANVQQWTYFGSPNQQFILFPTGDGYYKLIPKHSGKVVEVAGAQTNGGANVQQWTNNNQTCGQWKLIAPVASNGNGDGLSANYFNGMNFETLKVSRKDATVNFDWGLGSPDATVNVDQYSARWTGQIQPRYSGIYTFYINSDNGRRVWIDNQLIIDQWVDDWGKEYTGSITLTAGQKYDIKVEYFENNGGAGCKLEWSSLLQGREVVPQSQLYSNALPVVSITSPANDATFNAPASININVNATDANGSVAKVEFFNGDAKLGEDASAPYTFSWTNVAAGNYAITAVATDNVGGELRSSIVNVTSVKGNVPPSVTITNPTNNASFLPASNVTIQVNATDSDGSITLVEFFNGGVKIGEDNSAPYSFVLSNVTLGSYTITAKATDNSNASTTSAPITFTVSNIVTGNGDGLTGNYFNGMNFETPVYSQKDTSIIFDWGLGSPNASVNVDGFSARWTGQIQAKYSETYTFYLTTDNGRRLWINNQLVIDKWIDDWDITYTGTIDLVANQKYEIKIEYFENNGGANAKFEWSSTSQARQIVPKSQLYSNVLPVVSITSPANNATFNAPATVNFTSSVSDADGSVSKVDYYNGTTLLGSTTSPFSFSWSNVAAGTYTVTAIATDNRGGVTVSSPISVVVKSTVQNQAPSVTITSPTNNASFNAPATIALSANATDADGTISKVEFFNGSTSIGSASSAPYNVSWNNVTAGTYTLTAKATDNSGAVTTSASVTVTVKPSSTNQCSSLAVYTENGGYVDGSKVQNGGSIYQCKPYPFTGWCNGASWAYAPGTGAYWSDAWTLLGPCTAAAAVPSATLTPSFGPNPATDVITLNVSEGSLVTITNTQGLVMLTQNVSANGIVNVSSLPAGIYSVKIETATNVMNSTLVKN